MSDEKPDTRERPVVLLPTHYDLVPHSDARAAACGVSCCEISLGGRGKLALQVAHVDNCVDAELIWRRPVGESVVDGRKIVIEEYRMAQVVGANDVPSAIRAVEEAAVAAGWAKRS